MNKSIAQDMAYRQSLMKYAEKYGVSRASRNTTRAGRTSTSGSSAGMEVRHPFPVSPGGLTAIQTSIRKQNGNSSGTCAAEIQPWA